MRASVKILGGTLSLDIRAELQLWGPPFSGRAMLKIDAGLTEIEVEMRFGSLLPPQPKALYWSEFRASLLPADNEICNITVADGLLRNVKHGEVEAWVINPKELVLTTDAAIPSTQSSIPQSTLEATHDETHDSNQKLSIRPMNLRSPLTSTQAIDIKREGLLANSAFQFVPIYKRVPSALWGEGFMPRDPNAPRFVENVLCGFTISPAQPPEPGISQAIEYQKLLLDAATEGASCTWAPAAETTLQRGDSTITSRMQQHLPASATRSTVLADLGFKTADVTISDAFWEQLLGEPHIANAAIATATSPPS